MSVNSHLQAGTVAALGSQGVRRSARLLARPLLLGPVIVALGVLAVATLPARQAVVGTVLAAALVAVSAIDIEAGVLPNRVVLPSAGLVLTMQLALRPGHAAQWVLAPLAAATVVAIPHLLGRTWMGMGDAKLALLIGAGLGWQVFGALVVAFVCVFPVALVVLIRGGLSARKTAIPFGPFMALGALIVLLSS
jgi:leader peptidase (prepilin peptidase)/N-methyltransferase